eukprot:TRINITY_DN8009_c0_g1_i2.p1 TRINITY_DN8009_c0_g1~~TRINITY_DN8009_c0_g1_i2.p1  ORF type:complete len:163 (-),score=28.18 TRINITY_DN8009_c0_g1_i2:93-581(-)
MNSLKLFGDALESKKFRDNFMKSISHLSKFLIRVWPETPQFFVNLGEHAGFSRKIYRWGTFSKDFHTFLILLSLAKKDLFHVIIVFCSVMSNAFDSVSYVFTLLKRNKTNTDFYASLFYCVGLSLSITTNLPHLCYADGMDVNGSSGINAEYGETESCIWKQ